MDGLQPTDRHASATNIQRAVTQILEPERRADLAPRTDRPETTVHSTCKDKAPGQWGPQQASRQDGLATLLVRKVTKRENVRIS